MYDEQVGRWILLDPKANKREWLSANNFVQNNPLLKKDSDGQLDGDYYDINHNYVGTDGINVNKIYIVNTKPPDSIDPSVPRAPTQTTITYVGQISDVFKTGETRTDKNIASLHPAIRWKATDFMNEINTTLDLKFVMAQGLRTFEQQDAMYAEGRTKPGKKVTRARGGFSNHNYGFAFDIAGIDAKDKLTYELDWPALKTIGNKHGFEWGGDWITFEDKPHFENSFGRTMSELRRQYNAGNRTGPYINLSN